MTASETVLKLARELPEEQMMEVALTISHELSDAAEEKLTAEERDQIEGVLADRIDGPFEKPTREEFDAKVDAEVARLNGLENA